MEYFLLKATGSLPQEWQQNSQALVSVGIAWELCIQCWFPGLALRFWRSLWAQDSAFYTDVPSDSDVGDPGNTWRNTGQGRQADLR